MVTNPVITILHAFYRLYTRSRNYKEQDRIAMQIAARYGMTEDYKEARRHNMRPLQALEDWDLIRSEEERRMFD